MLRIEHLTKTFGKKTAVDDLTLHIAPGEICGFIGPNGAGKTTTLKSVIGIQSIDEGEILINGISVTGGAIFFSTHMLEVAEKLCDKVAIIKQGKLIKVGTMEEVKGDESLEAVFLELEAE